MFATDLLGKASEEKPWMRFYPEALKNYEPPFSTLWDYLLAKNTNHDAGVLEYYGTTLSLNDILDSAEVAAKAMTALGVKLGDRIPVFLQSVPEFVIIMLAVEKIGAEILCRDGTLDECDEAIKNAKGPIVITHDYLSKEEETRYYENEELKHIVLLSPYTYAIKSTMPDYIINNIERRYPKEPASNANNLNWNEFMTLGKNYTGNYVAPADPKRPFYRTYTSGSTGASKQLIHSAYTLLGGVDQIVSITPSLQFFARSLVTVLPPALIAVVSSMTIYRIATDTIVVYDPFCDVEDIDLEFMRLKPNCWNAIPQLAEALVKSKRIPADFPMNYIFQVGGGAESLNNKRARRAEKFFRDHGYQYAFTMGYGMSEAGSVITCAYPGGTFENCTTGIPIIGTTVGIFDKDTCEELDYGEIGEICEYSPGNMIGYDNPFDNLDILKTHEDGRVWLHTGDFGYMNEKGELHPLSRGLKERFGGGYLLEYEMENKIVEISGVDDGFFVIAHDLIHKGYFVPYLYLILEDGVKLEDVEPQIYKALKSYEYPIRINLIKHRSYYHFKTNRRILEAEINNKQNRNNIVEKRGIL